MKIPKSLLVAGAIATVGLAGATGLGVASAATSSSSTSGTSIVDKLAAKFNLKKEDVQSVFDEDRTAHEAEHQQELSDRLQKLVDNGKITADQKTKIEAKQKELQTARENAKTALEQWAKDNGIDTQYLHLEGGPGRGHGGPGGMDHDMM